MSNTITAQQAKINRVCEADTYKAYIELFGAKDTLEQTLSSIKRSQCGYFRTPAVFRAHWWSADKRGTVQVNGHYFMPELV